MKITDEDLSKKYENKRRDAKKRGILFTLTKEDFRALFQRNEGFCDYTGVKFDNEIHTISVERMDDKLGYIRGNVCLTSRIVNTVKDYTLDKLDVCVVKIPQTSEAILQVIKEKVTDAYKKFLSYKYNNLSKFESSTYKNYFKDVDYSGFYDKMDNIVKQKELFVRNENGVLQMSENKVSNDVRIATYYSDLAKHAAGEKKEFSVSFAEFKAKFSSTKCKITGSLVEQKDKVFILLDQSQGYTKDNIVLVNKEIGSKMVEASKLLGMSIPEMAKNLNPFVKNYIPKKQPAPKVPLVSLSSIMKKTK